MLKLALALLLVALPVALPMIAVAAEETIVHSPGPAPKSWLVNDIFHLMAHICQTGTISPPCEPDNVVSNSFSALIRYWATANQSYTRFYIITDTEGAVVYINSFTTNESVGVNTIFLSGISLPDASDVATRGLYKFISLIVGNSDGKIAFSDYYRFRVL